MLKVHKNNDIVELILARPEKQNAFNDELIQQLRQSLQTIKNDPQNRVLILRAEGSNFCAGADLNWMKKMASYSLAENIADAEELAGLFHDLHHLPIPTIGLAHGSTLGGGVGLLACCDIRIAAENAVFCFSETMLGLTPSTIAPYILATLGASATRRYFLTAERFSATTAKQLQFIHEAVPQDSLLATGFAMANKLLKNEPNALTACKELLFQLTELPPNQIQHYTATHIAQRRVSAEAQLRLEAFLCSKKS